LLLADGFLTRENDKMKLTDKGNICAVNLLALDVFKKERIVLGKHKKGLTETNITKIFQVG
ncbi:serine/threonine protein kinase, partial [Escherichia coli]|nr:serine/threonine protein kinase [Escherichia coli]